MGCDSDTYSRASLRPNALTGRATWCVRPALSPVYARRSLRRRSRRRQEERSRPCGKGSGTTHRNALPPSCRASYGVRWLVHWFAK